MSSMVYSWEVCGSSSRSWWSFIKDKYHFYVHLHVMYLYMFILMSIACICCMYRLTFISELIYLLAEYVVCFMLYIYTDGIVIFMELA
jgi:hypothetical protein